jgi:hypothetical protein
MPNVFISYRREDTEAIGGRIYDRLVQQYGRDSVMMDVDSIPSGVDYPSYVDEAVSKCDVLLALIGEHWLNARKGGQRRLDDPTDLVRLEIEAAFAKGVPVVPVLIGRTAMPEPKDLPATLTRLARQNAANVDTGRDFHLHMDRLIQRLDADAGAASQPFKKPGIWAQLASGIVEGLSKQAARTPSGQGPARGLTSAVDLTGSWRSNFGVSYSIVQQGSEFSMRGFNPQGAVVMNGQGRVTGDHVDVTFTAIYPPPVTGSGQGQIVDFGRRIVGVFQDPIMGTAQIELQRTG